MKLYSYFRSSAAYRLRIALNLKGLPVETAAVNLLKGEQQSDEYRALNPAGLVPALVLDDEQVLTQSIAILEWLEDCHPQPALLPGDALARARARTIVNLIACDIHPICNLGVVNYLKTHFQAEQDDVVAWFSTWMNRGFTAIEPLIEQTSGPYCLGDRVSLADVCLIPQVYNANRFGISLDPYPRIAAVNAACLGLDAFSRAAPEQQPDCPHRDTLP